MSGQRRSGAALVLALLAIIVLDCIVLGTLHIAMQEHRIGVNRTTILQLRLDAEGGARRAVGLWTVEVDSMPVGGSNRIAFPASGTAPAQVQIERLSEQLFLVESVAAEPPPRFGRAAARLLLEPPALPPGTDPALVPITTAGAAHITSTASIMTSPPAGCAVSPPAYSISAPPSALTIEAGSYVQAPPAPPGPQPVINAFPRISQTAPSILASDSTLSANASGVLLSRGSITLTGSAEFRGLIIAYGTVTIGPDASVVGAVHAGASVHVAGRVTWDGCAVQAALEASRLDRPTPASPRAWLPAF